MKTTSFDRKVSRELKIYRDHESFIKKHQCGKLIASMIANGHGSFLTHWKKSNQDLSQKQTQLRELVDINQKLKKTFKGNLGGLIGYLNVTKKILQKEHSSPSLGKKKSQFSPPSQLDLRFLNSLSPSKKSQNKNSMLTYEEAGLSHLDKVGLVLVAGGLGERLRNRKTKISLKVHHLHRPEIPDETFLGFYLKSLLALQKLYTIKTGKAIKIPLFIMCSDHNYLDIKQIVHSHYSLGICSQQVTITQQIKAPCLKNLQGEIALHGRYGLIKKPLGHGFVHALIHQKRYLYEPLLKNKEHLFFLQDTNPQSVNILLSSYGVARQLNYAMTWVTVERNPGEQAGLIVSEKVEGKNRKAYQQVCNIEYNQLDKGHMSSQFNLDKFFANTNNFWLRISDYQQALKLSHGIMPFIVNPKPKVTKVTQDLKLNPTNQYQPFRPETLMQDIAKELLPSTNKQKSPTCSGIVIYPRIQAFSPVKKPLLLTKRKLSPQDIAYTFLELELNDNQANLEKLRKNNTILTASPSRSKPQILLPLFTDPKVILDPIYKISGKYLNQNIQNCVFHPQSFTVLSGTHIQLKNVTIEKNAALLISLENIFSKEIYLTLENVTVNNHGFVYKVIPFGSKTSHFSEADRNRGYRVTWIKPLVIKIDKPGYYRYDEKGFYKIKKENE